MLGVDQLKFSDFKIYPNPFVDKIHIENTGLQQYKLTVLSSLGQTISQKQINSENTVIDLADLKAGIYFLRIDNGVNTMTMKILQTTNFPAD